MRHVLVLTLATLTTGILGAQTPDVVSVIDTETAVGRVAFSADSKTVAGIGSVGVRFWDVASGELLRTVAWEREDRFNIAMSPPVDWVARVKPDATVSFWNLANDDVLAEPRTTSTSASPASSRFSPDGSLLAHTNHRERKLRVWEVPSGRLRFVTETGIGPTSALAFSPNGTVLVAANGDTDLYVWGAGDGRLLRVLDELQLLTSAVTFSPDGRYLISAGIDRNVYVWDTRTWRRAREFEQQQPETIRSLDVSPDGRVVATGGLDATDNDNPAHLILWDFSSGEELARTRLPRAVTSLAFSPDGVLLAALARGENRIRLWRLSELLE